MDDRKKTTPRYLLPAVCSLALIMGETHAGVRIHYVHNDHLGTPQALTDGQQTVIWQASYQPFGKAVVDEDPDGDGNIVDLPLRFPGQYYDASTGLYYNYYRDYDPSLGRYVQSDPIGLAGGISSYGYAHQNPVQYVDPDGRLALHVISGAVGAVLAAHSTYSNTGSLSESLEAAIVGGLSNAISGRALFNAALGAFSNLVSQVDGPCFEGFDYSQIAAAGTLGGLGLADRVPYKPNMSTPIAVVAYTATTQILSTEAVQLF